VNHKNEVRSRKARLTVGDYFVGGFCETDAKGVMLWCLHRASLPTFQPELRTRILLFGRSMRDWTNISVLWIGSRKLNDVLHVENALLKSLRCLISYALQSKMTHCRSKRWLPRSFEEPN
jgi:hypothetical protein